MKNIKGLGFINLITEYKDVFGVEVLKEKDFSKILEDMKLLKENEHKAYLIEKEDKFRAKTPFYVVNKDFIIDHDFMRESAYEVRHLWITRNVYDKSYNPKYNYKHDEQFKPILSFASVEYPDYLTKIQSKNIYYDKLADNGKSILHFEMKELEGVIDANRTDTNNITFKKKKGLVKFEFKEDSFIVTFNSSSYNKIMFDYNFNMIEVDFSSILKNKINLEKVSNVNSYEELMNKINSSLEVYNLMTDKKYIVRATKEDFVKQMDLIKLIVKNKKEIITISKKIKEEILKISFKYNVSEKYKFNSFLQKEKIDLNNVEENGVPQFPSHASDYKRIMMFLLNTKDTENAIDLNVINSILKLDSLLNTSFKKNKKLNIKGSV